MSFQHMGQLSQYSGNLRRSILLCVCVCFLRLSIWSILEPDARADDAVTTLSSRSRRVLFRYCCRPCGATVARLTPDQKVACSNHVGVIGNSFAHMTFQSKLKIIQGKSNFTIKVSVHSCCSSQLAFYPEKLKLWLIKSSPPLENCKRIIYFHYKLSCIMRSHNFSVAFLYPTGFEKLLSIQARLAQSVEHETLNLGVVGSSPTLGANIFLYLF